MNKLENISYYPEFSDHYGVFKVEDSAVGLRGYIAIHRLNDNFASLGATRLWSYQNDDEAIRDSLRLSKLMSYKSALAGLPYGGAKASLILPKNGIADRKAYFKSYAEQVNELQGKFVTGTDVGVSNEDLDIMKSASKYMIGTGVNSAYYTAIGVKSCIEVIFEMIFNSKSLRGRKFAVQGVGKTGSELINLLIKDGVEEIYISDVDSDKIKKIRNIYPFLKAVDPGEIHKQEVDVFSPSALSGVLNKDSIAELKCRAIVGSANNQLSGPEIADILMSKGIYYVPDYLANSGGIVSVVDQYRYGVAEEKRIRKELEKIPENLKLVIETSKKLKNSLEKEALVVAENILNNKV